MICAARSQDGALQYAMMIWSYSMMIGSKAARSRISLAIG
jgi:hypothetical protein